MALIPGIDDIPIQGEAFFLQHGASLFERRQTLRSTRKQMMLKRISSPFVEFGLLDGLLYVIDRILGRISPRLRVYVYELMVQPITDKPLVNPRLVKSIEIREIRRGDPEVERMPARADIKESRFAQGAICLGAFQKGQFIGYMWFCRNEYLEDEVRCTYQLDPPARSVFDFDLYLFPEHRMGLGFVGLWNGANTHLRSIGVDFTFSRLTRFNVASRRAHQHLGWKRVGKAVFFQFWALEVMLGDLFPFVGVSVDPRRRLSLKLDSDALAER